MKYHAMRSNVNSHLEENVRRQSLFNARVSTIGALKISDYDYFQNTSTKNFGGFCIRLLHRNLEAWRYFMANHRLTQF